MNPSHHALLPDETNQTKFWEANSSHGFLSLSHLSPFFQTKSSQAIKPFSNLQDCDGKKRRRGKKIENTESENKKKTAAWNHLGTEERKKKILFGLPALGWLRFPPSYAGKKRVVGGELSVSAKGSFFLSASETEIRKREKRREWWYCPAQYTST